MSGDAPDVSDYMLKALVVMAFSIITPAVAFMGAFFASISPWPVNLVAGFFGVTATLAAAGCCFAAVMAIVADLRKWGPPWR